MPSAPAAPAAAVAAPSGSTIGSPQHVIATSPSTGRTTTTSVEQVAPRSLSPGLVCIRLLQGRAAPPAAGAGRGRTGSAAYGNAVSSDVGGMGQQCNSKATAQSSPVVPGGS